MSAGTSHETPETAAADFLTRLRKPAHILVAISGGSDSTGLLVALGERVKSLFPTSVRLSAATIDHGLRPESADEARHVATFCASHGIAHTTARWDGDKPHSGMMAAAREARYGLLADIAADLSADVIVTAHTLGDQQETLAMREARLAGGGSDTAIGIADAVLFDRRIWVARPFLRCRREDIRGFLEERGIAWFDDPSNDDIHYERVRTRKRLAAEPPSSFPDGGRVATRLALSADAADWLDAWFTVIAGGIGRIEREGLSAPEALLAYALSGLTAAFGGQAYGPGRRRLQGVLDFLRDGAPGRRTAGGVVFDLRRDGLYLVRENRGIRPLTIPPGGGGVWDGRFEIVNNDVFTIQVEAAGTAAGAGAGTLTDLLPRSVRRRALAVLPMIVSPGHPAANDLAAAVTILPRLAPFDRFLTRPDLAFANCLAVSFERKPYLPSPFEELLTENAQGDADCLGKGQA